MHAEESCDFKFTPEAVNVVHAKTEGAEVSATRSNQKVK
jgi:hypothetical protein